MSDQQISEADIALLERLGAIADAVDPVPSHVLEASRAAFTFRNFDAELMEAVDVDGDRVEAVRGASPTSRMHFFEFGEMSVDLEITSAGLFCHLVGLVADPAGAGGTAVTLETKSASFTSAPDEDGRFEFKQVPAGLVRLLLERGDRSRLMTPWFDAE